MQRAPLTGSQPPHVSIITLGCAKNEVDSRAMAQALRIRGYAVDMTDDPSEGTDAIIVNTCSFIQSATEQSIDEVLATLSLPWVKERSIPLIVAGCMPARYGEELSDALPEIPSFLPCADEDSVVEVVQGLIGEPETLGNPSTIERTEDVCPLAGGDKSIDDADQGCFAYVKISDGCDRWCSYCTIPRIRGPYHSYPFDTISEEVQRLIQTGKKEIVLIAQDSGRWGTDLEEVRSLAWLLATLATNYPDVWFRVMYLQPEGVTDELLATMAAHDNICNYLDIPLQHIESSLLAAMNRIGSPDAVHALLDRIRERIPGITLRTTLIAGFPGETEEDFAQLLSFVEEGLFDYVGVFPYSQEEGTRAATLPSQIEEDEKLWRAQQLREAADAASASRIKERIGSVRSVLIEGVEEDGQLYGRCQDQAPDVDGVTFLDRGEVGHIVPILIDDTLYYDMEGHVL